MTLEQLRKKCEKGLEFVQEYSPPFACVIILKDKEGHLRVHHYFKVSGESWNISVDARCEYAR